MAVSPTNDACTEWTAAGLLPVISNWPRRNSKVGPAPVLFTDEMAEPSDNITLWSVALPERAV